MRVTTPSGDHLTIDDPTAPTPGGIITVKDPESGVHFDVPNPLGSDTTVLTEDVWLRPVYEQVEGARRRGESGTTTRWVLAGWTVTDDADPQGQLHRAGDVVRVDLLPEGVATEDGEDE